MKWEINRDRKKKKKLPYNYLLLKNSPLSALRHSHSANTIVIHIFPSLYQDIQIKKEYRTNTRNIINVHIHLICCEFILALQIEEDTKPVHRNWYTNAIVTASSKYYTRKEKINRVKLSRRRRNSSCVRIGSFSLLLQHLFLLHLYRQRNQTLKIPIFEKFTYIICHTFLRSVKRTTWRQKSISEHLRFGLKYCVR